MKTRTFESRGRERAADFQLTLDAQIAARSENINSINRPLLPRLTGTISNTVPTSTPVFVAQNAF